jgi:hypothetical protein
MREVNSSIDIPFISRLLRNHALEHATMNVLSERYAHLRLIGRSTTSGFYIYGDVPTEGLASAARDGLQRLKMGQRHLAIHPACGTNLAVAGILAGLGAFLALEGLSRNRSHNIWHSLTLLPTACVAAMFGVLLAQPLGPFLQSHVTTRSDVGDLHIVHITHENRAGILVHRVRTGG